LAFNAFAADIPGYCKGEITALANESGFNIQRFMKDLLPAVAKAKAEARLPFGRPKDSDKTNIGMTFGCLKNFPESPGELQSLIQEVATDVVTNQLYITGQEAQQIQPPQAQYQQQYQPQYSYHQEPPLENREFRFGFYGALSSGGGGIANFDDEPISFIGVAGSMGMLFDIGNGLELGLGIGISRFSETEEIKYDGNRKDETREFSMSVWELIPSMSYAFVKKDIISYGAGLNLHFASWSETTSVDGKTVTTEPPSMSVALFPNFFIKAEVVKNFAVGLKTGFMINMPGEEIDENDYSNSTETKKCSIIDIKTELFVSFYL
jgi:hypothetical protein